MSRQKRQASSGRGPLPTGPETEQSANDGSHTVTQSESVSKDERMIEAPVKVRVYRTIKKRSKDGVTEENSKVDQENPDQKPTEGGEDPDFETIEIRRFVTDPAKVRFHFDIGRNAHFQSASAGASVEIPCYVEEIDEAFDEAKRIVLNRMRPEVKELNKVLDFLVEQRVKKDQDLNKRGIA